MQVEYTPPKNVQGIHLFEDRSDCISHYKEMHWTKKALSLIQSFGTLLKYALFKGWLICNRAEKTIDQQNQFYQNYEKYGLSKKRLIVCIHGLNNNPSQFTSINAEILQKEPSETQIFIPRVLEKGNAKLDDMVQPIFDEIAKWAAAGKDKELVLIGISNGGRIARAIDAKISTLESSVNIKKVRFISIVGACKGSSLVNLAKKVRMSWMLSKNIAEEMPKGSERNKRLNADWKQEVAKPNGPEREYTFFASPHDWQVTNYSSSLMKVKEKHKAHYAIVPGHGHNSIVNATAKTIAEIFV